MRHPNIMWPGPKIIKRKLILNTYANTKRVYAVTLSKLYIYDE